MNIHLQLLILSAVLVYCVDVSGFTQAWRSALARWLKKSPDVLRPLPPFDCGKCAVFWGCLLWAAVHGALDLLTLAQAAALSLLSLPIGQLMIFIREGLLALIDKIQPDR